MNELTMLFFLCALAMFVLIYVFKNDNAVSWIAFFLSVCSIGQTITDTTVEGMEIVLLIVPMLYVFLMSGLSAMRRKAM